MYSWKTIRTVAAVLLLMPLVHLVFLISREALAALDASPKVWNAEMEAYAETDRLAERPTDPIVIVGGRRVVLWPAVEDLLAPKPVLMRGLGDATVEDIIFHYQRLIAFYQPQTVVLLPSNSEFHIRGIKSADELVASIQTLVELDQSVRKAGLFYIFAPLNTPLHRADEPKVKATTQALRAWAKSKNKVRILDANVLLSDGDGAAKANYFRADGVNLNELGYMRLSMLLLHQMEHDNPGEFPGL